MPNFIHITLIGHATRDAEMKSSPGGTQYAKFSLAYNPPVAKGQEKIVNFYDVTMFGKTAESAARMIKKGLAVCVAGRLIVKTWKTKDGETRVNLDLTANEFQMAGPRGESGGADAGEQRAPDAIAPDESAFDATGGIPF